MKKVTTWVLMLCLVLSGALCYASGVARTENGKGEITINAGELKPGVYVYTLIVDGSLVDTKQMILTK
jgi:hypothetical protein